MTLRLDHATARDADFMEGNAAAVRRPAAPAPRE